MSKIINIVLVLITLVLVYWLYASIQDPIAFHGERDKRKDAVIAKLKMIQTAQDVYRLAKGKYAKTFDSLAVGIMNGKVPIVKLEKDPSDPTNEDKFIKTVSYVSAKDTLFATLGKSISLDSLKYVPYGEGATFSINADTLTHQNSLVNVLEVGTRYKDFMGPFKSASYKKYDKYYDPEKLLKFGDMNTPNTNGNW